MKFLCPGCGREKQDENGSYLCSNCQIKFEVNNQSVSIIDRTELETHKKTIIRKINGIFKRNLIFIIAGFSLLLSVILFTFIFSALYIYGVIVCCIVISVIFIINWNFFKCPNCSKYLGLGGGSIIWHADKCFSCGITLREKK